MDRLQSVVQTRGEFTQQSEIINLDEDLKRKFISQLDTQTSVCMAGLKCLEGSPKISMEEFQRQMRVYIYSNDLHDKMPFKAAFNELYHVYKRFMSGKPVDKSARNVIYMTFYTYDFIGQPLSYNRDNKTLSITTPTLDMDICLTQPLSDEALLQTKTDRKSKYINIGYHRQEDMLTLDIFY